VRSRDVERSRCETLKGAKNATLADRFGEEVRGIVDGSDVFEADEFGADKIANVVQAKIHMLFSEPILTELTTGKVNGTSIVNFNDCRVDCCVPKDFLTEVDQPGSVLSGIRKGFVLCLSGGE
jgi:hypothetical protein